MNLEDNQYLALYGNYSFEKFLDLSSAMKSIPILIAKLRAIGRVSPLSKHHIYTFDIFDASGNRTNLYAGNWCVSQIQYYYYNWDWYTGLTIACPDKSTRKINLLNFNGTETSKSKAGAAMGVEYIVSLQEYLDTFRHFKDWTYYDLVIKNKKLEKKIEEQSKEIEKLKRLNENK